MKRLAFILAALLALPAIAHAQVSYQSAYGLVVVNGGGGGGGISPPAGQIGGSALSPTVIGIRETSGPTNLTIGAVADGQMLVRSGTTVVGQAVPSGSGTPATTVTAVGTQAVGVSTNYAREDHVHGHGNQAGGALHASVVAGGAAGFMTGADKTKLDAISGTNTGDQTITLTGNVTGSGTGSFPTTIAADAVANTMLANMNASTFKCRVTASTGDPEDCTAAQATSLLNLATTSVKGLMPALSNSATQYLDGTGNWSTPAGGGGGGVLDSWHFQAESLDDADPNTPNTTNAPLATSTLGASSALLVRSFGGGALSAAGGKLRVPTGATSCTFDWIYGAASAPGATNNKVRWKVGVRALGSTGALTDYTFTDQTNANNTTQAFFTETVTTSTLGWSTSTPYYFQLVRVVSGVTNNMTQAAELSEWDVRCQ